MTEPTFIGIYRFLFYILKCFHKVWLRFEARAPILLEWNYDGTFNGYMTVYGIKSEAKLLSNALKMRDQINVRMIKLRFFLSRYSAKENQYVMFQTTTFFISLHSCMFFDVFYITSINFLNCRFISSFANNVDLFWPPSITSDWNLFLSNWRRLNGKKPATKRFTWRKYYNFIYIFPDSTSFIY